MQIIFFCYYQNNNKKNFKLLLGFKLFHAVIYYMYTLLKNGLIFAILQVLLKRIWLTGQGKILSLGIWTTWGSAEWDWKFTLKRTWVATSIAASVKMIKMNESPFLLSI